MLLLSNLSSQKPEISGFEGTCWAGARSAQRGKSKMAGTKPANRTVNGVFISVVRGLQWTAAAADRRNHTTLRKHTYRQDPCSKCTRTCEVLHRSLDPAKQMSQSCVLRHRSGGIAQ